MSGPGKMIDQSAIPERHLRALQDNNKFIKSPAPPVPHIIFQTLQAVPHTYFPLLGRRKWKFTHSNPISSITTPYRSYRVLSKYLREKLLLKLWEKYFTQCNKTYSVSFNKTCFFKLIDLQI